MQAISQTGLLSFSAFASMICLEEWDLVMNMLPGFLAARDTKVYGSHFA